MLTEVNQHDLLTQKLGSKLLERAPLTNIGNYLIKHQHNIAASYTVLTSLFIVLLKVKRFKFNTGTAAIRLSMKPATFV